MTEKKRKLTVEPLTPGRVSCSWDHTVVGWEDIVVERPRARAKENKSHRFLKYSNKMARIGFWLSDEDLKHLVALWEPFLEPGDEIVVKSTKDRGRTGHRGSPDCTWSVKVVEVGQDC